MSEKLTLVSHKLCPYVQRAAIALAEKGVPFERVDIDLADKPDWFLKISPLGKVPLLKVGDAVIFESAVIVEYLEDTQRKPLHPADPLIRAQHRAEIEFASALLADIWVYETTKDEAAFAAKAQAIAAKFARLESVLGAGPFFAGKAFSLVDAAFAPVFRYIDLFDRIGAHDLTGNAPKLAAWRKALGQRPSVRGAVVAEYPDLLEAFVVRQNGVLSARLAARKAA